MQTRSQIFPFIIYLLSLWYFCLGILGTDLQFIPGDQGDSRFINYLLEHCYLWFTGQVSEFWQAGFMYPFSNPVALSDNMVGSAPFYAIWRVAGMDRETSYQLWWICICSLNFWSCYIVIYKLYRKTFLAVILAWLFAFSIFNLGQLNYTQMMVRFPVPLAFYAAIKLFQGGETRHLLLYCGAICLQFYCTLYTGFYLFYFSLLFIGVHVLLTRNSNLLTSLFNKKNRFTSALILLSTAGLCLLLLVPYLQMSEHVGLRLYSEVRLNIPTVASYLLPHESSVPWHFLFTSLRPGIEQWWLHYTFPGALLLLTLPLTLLLYARSRIRKTQFDPLRTSILFTALLLLLLHIRTDNGFSLYALIFKFPGINSMKVVNRFMHVESFLILLLLADLLKNLSLMKLATVAVLAFFDNLFDPTLVRRDEKLEWQTRTAQLDQKTRNRDATRPILALLDTNERSVTTHLDMMILAQEKRRKTINGYSSNSPPAFSSFFTRPSKTALDEWLHTNGIDTAKVLVIER